MICSQWQGVREHYLGAGMSNFPAWIWENCHTNLLGCLKASPTIWWTQPCLRDWRKWKKKKLRFYFLWTELARQWGTPCVFSHFSHVQLFVEHNPPGSSVHGILQARILEWVARPFFRGSSWPRDRTLGLLHISCTEGRFFTLEPPEVLPKLI